MNKMKMAIMSEVEIVDKLFGFIVGSYEITATTITLTMKYLKQNPEFFNEIMEGISSSFLSFQIKLHDLL